MYEEKGYKKGERIGRRTSGEGEDNARGKIRGVLVLEGRGLREGAPVGGRASGETRIGNQIRLSVLFRQK